MESSPASNALVAVVVAGLVLSVGGHALPHFGDGGVHPSQNRTETTTPCPTTETTDGRLDENRTTFGTETLGTETAGTTETTRITETTDSGVFGTDTTEGEFVTTVTTNEITANETTQTDRTETTGAFETGTTETLGTDTRTETTTRCPTAGTAIR